MLKRIHVQQLTLGMHIDGFCGPWMEHPFWRNHFVLTDPQDIALILASSIQEVWIDTSKGKDIAPDAPALAQAESLAAVVQSVPTAETAPPDTQPISLAAEYKRAAEICAKSKRAIMTMLQEARMGKTVDTELASHMVQEISDSMLRNHEAMINLARLKTADDYTYMHLSLIHI